MTETVEQRRTPKVAGESWFRGVTAGQRIARDRTPPTGRLTVTPWLTCACPGRRACGSTWAVTSAEHSPILAVPGGARSRAGLGRRVTTLWALSSRPGGGSPRACPDRLPTPAGYGLLRPADSGQVPTDNDDASGEIAEVVGREERANGLGDGARVLRVDPQDDDAAMGSGRVRADVSEPRSRVRAGDRHESRPRAHPLGRARQVLVDHRVGVVAQPGGDRSGRVGMFSSSLTLTPTSA